MQCRLGINVEGGGRESHIAIAISHLSFPPLTANSSRPSRDSFGILDGRLDPQLEKVGSWRFGLSIVLTCAGGARKGMPLLVGCRMPHLVPTRNHDRQVGTCAATTIDPMRNFEKLTLLENVMGRFRGAVFLIHVPRAIRAPNSQQPVSRHLHFTKAMLKDITTNTLQTLYHTISIARNSRRPVGLRRRKPARNK